MMEALPANDRDDNSTPLGRLLTPSQDPLRRGLLWKGLQMPLRTTFSLMFQYRAYGKEHLPKKGGVLLLSNHQSYLDPVLLGLPLQRPMSYMAKAELFSNPLFAWLIRSLHAFPVQQGKGDTSAMKETIRRLHEGHMLNIFPEGSRTEDGEIGGIERGAVLVIRRAKVPVVPVAINGSFKAWPKRQRLPRPHPIQIMYGPPLQLEGLDARQTLDLIDRTLRRMLRELRSME